LNRLSLALEYPMPRTLTFLALAALLTASACETMEGAGRDMTTAGRTVTSEAQKAAN
jgi:predicted small secreted protein